jgi:Domain of Unknown Function with PDB structure (DUF3857)/Transglutaminase-like superfamily
MKKLILNIIVLFLSIQIFAQNTEELKVKFGKISDAEIKMKAYEKDPDAPAVVLFDKGSMDFDYDEKKYFQGNYFRHARIKIFKKEAYNFANIRILYKAIGYDMQRISDLKAVCYNMENGKMVETKLTDENIFDEKLTKRISVKKFSIPAVREGSIIEFRYKINYDGIEVPDWQFQDEIPVIWSEFEAEIPEFFEFLPVTEGATPYLVDSKIEKGKSKTVNMSIKESGIANRTFTGTARINWKATAYHWVQKDVPAIKTEKYMTSAKDYFTKLNFQVKGFYNTMFTGFIAGTHGQSTASLTAGTYQPLYSSWGKVAEELMEEERFGNVMDKKSETKEEVAKIIQGSMTAKDKMNAIYNFIGKNYTVEERKSIFMSQSLSDLIKNHKGSSSDINLLFINMLRLAGLNASPIIISTRNNGRINRVYPLLDRLDKVIVHVKLSETDSLIVDATGYPQPINLLPFDDLNGEGFVIHDKKTTNWILIKNSVANKKFYAASYALNTEGVLSGDINFTFTGYSASENRLSIREDGSEKHMKSLVKGLLSDGRMESHKFENIELLSDLPLKGTTKLTTSTCINKANEKIYISPLVCLVEKENPFKAEERKYNIDFGEPRDEFYQVNIKLPDGYKVEEMPKTARIQLPEGAVKFEYLISVKENTVSINAKFNIKRSIFDSTEYKDLKQVYAQILAKMGEQIVLIKETK